MRRLALIGLAAVLLTACGGAGGGPAATGGSPKPGGTLKVATVEENRTLDPLTSGQFVERRVMYNMYESLVTIDDKLTIKPLLAERWEIPDPKTYVFTLKKGVKFHDGTDLNADAVKFNIDRILSAQKSPRKSELASVQSVEVKDPQTVVFHLKKPDAALLSWLVDRAGMVLSPAAIAKGGADFGRNPVGAGTGPFQFVEWKRDDHTTLKKNPNYWRPGLPYLDQIIFKPITDTNSILAGLRTGDIELAGDREVAGKDVQLVKADPNLFFRTVPSLSFFGFYVNHAAPPFNDPAKRKAVALALDKAQIVKNVYFNVSALSYGPIPPSSWAFDPSEKIFDKPDVDRAKATATAFSFKMNVPNSPDDVQAATLIKSQLAKAGITVDLVQKEFGQVLTEQENHMFEASYVGWSGRIDPDGNMFSHFHTGGGFNHGQYSNPQVDKLLDDARAAGDQAKRRQLYQDAQKLLVGDAAYMFIRHGPAIQASSKRVHGFPLNPDGMYRLGEVWKD